MPKHRGILWFILLAAGLCRSSEKPIPYISPGLRIGYEFGGGLTFNPKISIGLTTDPEYFNITFGWREQVSKRKEPLKDDYYFVQFQAGQPRVQTEMDFFPGGAGVGIAIFDGNGKSIIKPIFNFSFGLLLYVDIDIIPKSPTGTKVDLGLLGVLPIPLVKKDWFKM